MLKVATGVVVGAEAESEAGAGAAGSTPTGNGAKVVAWDLAARKANSAHHTGTTVHTSVSIEL